MLPKVLAWSSLGSAFLFVIATLSAVFAGDSLGEQGATISFWVGIGSLGLGILLAIVLLVVSAFLSDS
jgi:hypothetical protein